MAKVEAGEVVEKLAACTTPRKDWDCPDVAYEHWQDGWCTSAATRDDCGEFWPEAGED